jgi:hypothetical protein
VPEEVWWSLLRLCNLLKASYLLAGVPSPPLIGRGAVQWLAGLRWGNASGSGDCP